MDPFLATKTTATCYRPSGKVRWLPYFGLMAAVLLAAVCFADAAFRIDRAGWYPTFLGPFLASTALGSISAAAVAWSHCRNRMLARMLGVLAGTAFLLGFLEARLIDARTRGGVNVREIPWSEMLRGLPEYAVLRIQQISGGNGPPIRATGVVLAWRWFMFGVEVVLLLGVPAAAAAGAANRPYSESRRRWMNSTTHRLPADRGRLLLELLEGNDPSLAVPTATGVKDAIVVVESLPESPDDAAYVSVLDRDRKEVRRWLIRRRPVSSERLASALAVADPKSAAEVQD